MSYYDCAPQKLWGEPDIDIFASRLNYQTLPCVSWRPDPQATAIDAFTLNWNYSLIYAFPSISLIAPSVTENFYGRKWKL